MQEQYVVSLSQFEGPLDLLLHLISRAKISIKDIFVSEITQQYLSYVQNMQGLDMESASRFLTMAAFLVETKSRTLLPRLEEEQIDLVEEQKKLIQLLEQYAAIKKVCEALALKEEVGIARLYRLPEEMIAQEVLSVRSLSIDKLCSAMLALLAKGAMRTSAMRVRQLNRENFSVEGFIGVIRKRITQGKSLNFASLFAVDAPKDEVVAAFLAVLELIHEGSITIQQDKPFGQIELIGGNGHA